MRTLAVLVVVLLFVGPAHAGCVTVTVTTTSTQVFAANDVAPATLRIFSIQNGNPAGVDIWCAKGSVHVNGGNYLQKAGGQWSETVPLPTEEINCVSASGSTAIYACDYAVP